MSKPLKISLIIVAVIIALFALAVGAFFIIIEPNVNIFGFDKLDMTQLTSYSRTITILDADGNQIDGALYDNNKIYIKVEDLPDYTVKAFVAIEDKRFYDHKGVDYKRMASALMSNIKSGGFKEGASTITQQLIKNTHLSNEKTIRRKINEVRLARALERVYSKNQILESYFNILYFGSGIRGLGTASSVMFDKSASELTLAQSAALASIINNPSKYSPYNNIDNLNRRKELVLRQMLSQGFIDERAYSDAISEQLEFKKEKQNQYVNGLIKSACKHLHCSEKELFLNNYTFKTKYDPKVVDAARSAIKQTDVNGIIRVLVLDNASGGIVCDETNKTSFIDPRRSPASTIKPFLSYAPAIENGLNPLSQIDDSPASFGDYSPKNFRNVYRGYMSLKDCLKYSSNIAAVKLLQQTGVEKCKNIAGSFGLPFDAKDDSLSIALGGMQNGVTLPELANAYRTLANGGVYSPVDYLFSASDRTSVKFEHRNDSRRVIGDDTAYLLTDILTDCARSGTAKKLKYSGIIAAKTGTNGDESGNLDCYCVAYTPKNTIAVWFGAEDERIDNKVTGATCCDLIIKMVQSGAIETDNKFAVPNSVAYYEADGRALTDLHEVYLADPTLPQRYRIRALFSKRHLPIKKSVDIIDFYDSYLWDDLFGNFDDFDIADGALD